MQTKTVTVPNVSCEHCANLINSEVGEMAGVAGVQVDVPGKQVTVRWDAPADWTQIEALLTELEYPPAV